MRELADVDAATVSAAPAEIIDGVPNVQQQTALSLVRKGYVETVDDGRVAITREGPINSGRIVVSRAEGRRRRRRESLRAQASGEWQPAPADYSARAEEDRSPPAAPTRRPARRSEKPSTTSTGPAACFAQAAHGAPTRPS
jgi:hypothetical protein